MITNIRVDKIYPHPDNPRKDLGELTELAASIKANGILQNLTVVASTDPGELWRVIIGHRRLAAAKLAGLTEVPCVISAMDHKQQVATMLLENMQRNDLTIWEQAQGFQMMLDFGETIEDVSQLTGFSQNTIRRRVKLLDLDKDKFQKSVERGATLQDYIELDKIQSPVRKNNVLDKIGTNDFQWKLKQAIDEENKERDIAKLVAEIEKFATRIESKEGYRTAHWFYSLAEFQKRKPEDIGGKQYCFFVSSYGVDLCLESNEPIQKYVGPSPEEERKRQELRKQLDEVSKRAFQLRVEFVKNYSGRHKDLRIIMEIAFMAMLAGNFDYDLSEDVCEMLGIEFPDVDDDDNCNDIEVMAEAAAIEAFTASPEKVLFITAYCGMDSENSKYYDWRGKYVPNSALDRTYDSLERLGYQISAEEQALRDGTHELYVRESDKGAE